MTYHEHFANFSWQLWTELAAHLWQSTLFLLLVFFFVALLGKASAKSRYAVWLTASVKFALPLSAFAALGNWLDLGSLIPHFADVESPPLSSVNFVDIVLAEPIAAVISIAETPNNHHEIFCVLTLFWLVGCLSLFALWWKRSRSFKSLMGYRNTPTNEREAELLNNAQNRIGLTARVHLIISDSLLEPVVLGIWQPIIVMPRGLSHKLTDDEFESVLMHELSHVARRDNLVGVLQMALCCLLWFHPFVWFIKSRLLEERERACDEAVVRHESKPQIYAAGLLKVVRYGLHSQQSAGVANAASTNLNKRLELIMKIKDENMKTKWQKWIVGGAFGALIFVCVVASLVATQASGASNTELLTDSVDGKQSEAKFRQVEIYADGKLINSMELRSPKPKSSVFSYALYRIPEGQKARSGDDQKIYAFQLIPAPEADTVKVETVALLEDLNTASNSHPLHEFKKQAVATYNLRIGESAVVSEMSQFGVKPLEIKVTEAAENQNESRETGDTFKTVSIQKGEELPDISFKIVGNDDSPLKITEATGSQITNALYTKLTGQTTVITGADGKAVFPNVYGAPVVKMINNSGKTVTGLTVVVNNPRPVGSGQVRLVLQGKPAAPQPISILPGQSYTVSFKENHPMISEKYWLAGFTDPSNFYVAVWNVQFDDGTSWMLKEKID